MTGSAPVTSAAERQGWPVLGIVMLVVLWWVWGSSWPAMRIVFQEIPVWQFRAVTCAIGGLFLMGMGFAQRVEWRVPRRHWGVILGASFFNMTCWHILVGYGLTFMGAGHAAIIVYTLPVWTAVLSVAFLAERMTGRKILALALGMTGVVVLLASDFEALGTNPVGMIFLLGAAISWAIGTIIVKRADWTIGMHALAGWQLLIGLVPIAVIAALTERFQMHEMDTRTFWASVYVVFVAVVAGYALWFRIVRIFPATVASIGALVIPIIGLVSGAVVLDEPLTWREGVAMLCVMTAVALVVFRRQQPA